MKTLLYVTSSPRSGSTMLTNILGNHPNYFNVRELHRLTDLINSGSKVNFLMEGAVVVKKLKSVRLV